MQKDCVVHFKWGLPTFYVPTVKLSEDLRIRVGMIPRPIVARGTRDVVPAKTIGIVAISVNSVRRENVELSGRAMMLQIATIPPTSSTWWNRNVHRPAPFHHFVSTTSNATKVVVNRLLAVVIHVPLLSLVKRSNAMSLVPYVCPITATVVVLRFMIPKATKSANLSKGPSGLHPYSYF